MRRLAVAAFVLLLAGTFAFPSLAAPLFGGGDHVSQSVSLAPAEGPNGDYAYLRDGDLVVDLTAANPNVTGEGINDDAVTRIDAVFEIRYNGSQYADVWVSDDSPDVSFYARGHAIQSAEENVTLAPNETVAVGLTVDTRGDTTDGLIEDLTVRARVGEPSQTSNDALPTAVQAAASDDGTVTYTVSGADTGESVTLDERGVIVDRDEEGATVTLDALAVDVRRPSFDLTLSQRANSSPVDAPGVVEFGAFDVTTRSNATAGGELRFSVAQSYVNRSGVSADDIVVYHGESTGWRALPTTVTGSRDGHVRFVATTDGFSPFVVAAHTPAIAVSNASLEATQTEAGEAVAVHATVTNDGAARGNRSVTLRLNNATVATRTVSLAPEAKTSVTFTVNATPGEHAITVGNESAGSLVVAPAERESAPTTVSTTSETVAQETTRTQTPLSEPAGIEWRPLGGLLGALALVASALAVWRRSQ